MEDRQERLHQPLHLLKEVCSRLLNREIAFSQGRLESLYQHLAGALAEVLDYAQDALDTGCGQFQQAAQAAQADAPDSDFISSLQRFEADFAWARQEIEAGLTQARETFFAATSFADLEGQLGFVELAESRIQSGLQRLEATLLVAEDPDLWHLSAVPTAPEVPAALDELAQALQAVTTHLDDGNRAPLQEALAHLDKARAILAEALTRL